MSKIKGKAFITTIFSCVCMIFFTVPTVVFAQAQDPLEPVNRFVFKVNKFIDKWALKPVAQAYKAVTPDILERGFSNVYQNVNNIPTSVNNLLQGKPGQAGQDISRFIFNVTFGGLGFYDFASDIGFPIHQEDFGQTLGVWGVPSGSYLVLPLLGSSTLRDTIGWRMDQLYDPYGEIEPSHDRSGVLAHRIIGIRAQLLRLDNLAPGDEYLFFRDAYMQRRAGLVMDGKRDSDAEDDFLNEDF